MKIIVGCEESQEVTKAFRALGHEAYSCDLQECSGGYPEWHIKGDVLNEAYSGKYDLGIFHPPCTFLANSGVRWLNIVEGFFLFAPLQIVKRSYGTAPMKCLQRLHFVHL